MPHRMESAMLIFVPADSRFIHVVDNALLQMVAVPDGVERRHMLEEDKVRAVILGTPILDVVDDSPTNSVRNRQ